MEYWGVWQRGSHLPSQDRPSCWRNSGLLSHWGICPNSLGSPLNPTSPLNPMSPLNPTTPRPGTLAVTGGPGCCLGLCDPACSPLGRRAGRREKPCSTWPRSPARASD